ncbi:diheme cytochrome SoxA (sulfur oxidation) [Magnetococcus marinus MC-1]|uniref:SoxAX cytochrome complex subunit A n=1 Tax=Magnetococcus marinus (strain ATCC BAA-1437 / JCM 17883 / MC-1) TaxID=156889 RepID=A0LE06_MAGMM|nr:sulfur oxidation c-type cytochrome SoxA [Magnetococcus marinus]ABK46199.1 diheme cytochrome SoxA (sulfur oxidation) [Magnetococcus marinus MC-1]
MTNKKSMAGITGLLGAALLAGSAWAMDVTGYNPEIDQGLYKYSDKFREMADFPPSEGAIEDGKGYFNKMRGEKSCASCHGEDGEALKGVGATYPKYDEKMGKPKLLQHQIERCLTEQMGQPPLKWESPEQVLLVTYIKALSNGMPLNVKTDGPVAKYVKMGEASYFQRAGHFDVACVHCHETAAGHNIRAEYMSAPNNTGMHELSKLVAELPLEPEQDRRNAAGATIGSGSVDHWPTYRLKWGKPATMQHRLRTCNKNVRAEPKGYGDDYYVNLELYLASKSNGLPMNVPGFRP